MSDKSVYDIIKRQNGEAFARAIRDFDNGIFEVNNLPEIVKYAGRNVLPLLDYLESLKQIEIKEVSPHLIEDPFTLLKRAGYDAFYADTLEKQNSIIDYYAKMEELCTFRDETRFEDYYIIHCIKEGARDLKRSDFTKPDRQDEYGTSVISIQILKEGGFISIKNRYNHAVLSPDNTFNSNPDNIIGGLSASLKNYFDVDFSSQDVELDGAYQVVDGKIYYCHTERNNIYYGENYYIKDDKVHFINLDYQMIVDDMLIDFKENRIFFLDEGGVDVFYNPDLNLQVLIYTELEDKKLTRKKEGDLTLIYADDQCVLKARKGALVYCDLKGELEFEEAVFIHHPTIEEAYFENLETLGAYSFKNCPKLRVVSLPKCKKIIGHCFVDLPSLQKVELPELRSIVNSSFERLDLIEEMTFPKLQTVGMICFRDCPNLKKLSAPNLQIIGINSIVHNDSLEEVYLPELTSLVGFNLTKCRSLKNVCLDSVSSIGDCCLSENDSLEKLYLPSLERLVSERGFCNNQKLKSVVAPKLIDVPNFNLLPALEHFECAKGVYARKMPSWISSNDYMSKQFVMKKREKNHER